MKKNKESFDDPITTEVVRGLLDAAAEEVQQVLIVIRDLTHEREIERLRDAFLRTVTHELRTPLTSVIAVSGKFILKLTSQNFFTSVLLFFS